MLKQAFYNYWLFLSKLDFLFLSTQFYQLWKSSIHHSRQVLRYSGFKQCFGAKKFIREMFRIGILPGQKNLSFKVRRCFSDIIEDFKARKSSGGSPRSITVESLNSTKRVLYKATFLPAQSVSVQAGLSH